MQLSDRLAAFRQSVSQDEERKTKAKQMLEERKQALLGMKHEAQERLHSFQQKVESSSQKLDISSSYQRYATSGSNNNYPGVSTMDIGSPPPIPVEAPKPYERSVLVDSANTTMDVPISFHGVQQNKSVTLDMHPESSEKQPITVTKTLSGNAHTGEVYPHCEWESIDSPTKSEIDIIKPSSQQRQPLHQREWPMIPPSPTKPTTPTKVADTVTPPAAKVAVARTTPPTTAATTATTTTKPKNVTPNSCTILKSSPKGMADAQVQMKPQTHNVSTQTIGGNVGGLMSPMPSVSPEQTEARRMFDRKSVMQRVHSLEAVIRTQPSVAISSPLQNNFTIRNAVHQDPSPGALDAMAAASRRIQHHLKEKSNAAANMFPLGGSGDFEGSGRTSKIRPPSPMSQDRARAALKALQQERSTHSNMSKSKREELFRQRDERLKKFEALRTTSSFVPDGITVTTIDLSRAMSNATTTTPGITPRVEKRSASVNKENRVRSY